MAIHYSFRPELNLLAIGFFGVITDSQVLTAYKQCYANSQMRPGLNEIIICDDNTVIEISDACMAEMMSQTILYHGQDDGRTRSIHVFANVEQQEASRLYEQLIEWDLDGVEFVEQFSSLQDALSSLGISIQQEYSIRQGLAPEQADGIVIDER